MTTNSYDLIIVGGGPAGIAAAVYGGRAGLKTILLEAVGVGGMVGISPLVENYPGIKAITGMELAENMKEHALACGAEIMELEKVVDIDPVAKKVTTASGSEFVGKVIILSTGSEHRKLGIPGEKEFQGRGVSQCATCDGPLFKGKKVVVVGGGNAAAVEALHLADLARKTYLIHRRDDLRADKALKDQVLSSNIEVIWDTVLTEVEGDEAVKRVRMKNVKTEEEKSLRVKGAFISIGIIPNNELAQKAGLELHDSGLIKVDEKQRTSKEGIYAAGDVTPGERQVSVAVGEGTTAALSAYLYIRGGHYGSWGEGE